MSYIGNEPTSVAFLTDTFSGNGSTTAFTMSAAPATTTSILVAVTGVLQDPSTYSVVGTTLTFSAAPPSGTGNISVRYLGIPASGVTTTAYRTITEFTATAGQTTFTPPSYTPGFINVYRNGALLSTTDYTATNGTTVVLGSAASASDLVTIESFYVSSVLNALPQTGGTLSGSLVVNGATGQNPLIVQNNTTEAMRVNSSGNVGIGTNSPSTKLQVAGTSGSPQFQAGTAANGYFQINAFDSNPVYCVIAGTNATAGVFGTQSNIPTILFTNNTERMRIDTSGYVTNAVNGLGNGLVQAQQYYRLNSGFVGANSNTAQPMFGVGVTLVANTVYEFEIMFVAVKTAGTTSHTISLQFAGTATLNNILYNGFAMADNSNIPYARIVNTQTTFASNSANALAITGAITAATHNCYFTLKGTVSVANGGTFIPQYVLSAAPGGAYTTQAGSYVKISALSASGSNTSIGTWA